MKSIEHIITNSITIKKSEFITTLIPCWDIDSVNEVIQAYSKDDATHNCVAYIIGPYEKAMDDGEPGGTAGLPMLNVLKRQGLENVVAIVTRYFGGIKLGAGGLTRAYSQSVSEAVKLAHIVQLELVEKIQISFNYHFIKKIDYLLKKKNITIIDTTYDEKVHYTFYNTDDHLLDDINDITSTNYTYQLLGKDYIGV